MKRIIASIYIILILFLASSCTSFPSREYCDVNMYINKEYLNEQYFKSSFVVSRAGPYADKFFIPYDEINFDYEDMQFYVFDGTDSITKPGISLSLDMKFGENYHEVKDYLINKYNFYDDDYYKATIGKYTCQIVSDEEITSYIERFGMLCYCDLEKTIRLFYYYDEDYDLDKSLNEYKSKIIKCSNCVW